VRAERRAVGPPEPWPPELVQFRSEEWADRNTERRIAREYVGEERDVRLAAVELERHRAWTRARREWARAHGLAVLGIMRDHEEWRRAQRGGV
jgi:hypothetical protein